MQTHRLRTFLSLTLLFACMPAFAQTQAPTPADNSSSESADGFCQGGPATVQDDAYHYKYWQGTPYDAAYTEWWYFNLYDDKQDLKAIFSYQVVDPGNIDGKGSAFVAAAAYQGNQIINTVDLFPLSAFSASYAAADASFGENKISVVGPDSYQITGASSNGRIRWNLHYERASDSWCAADHVNVAPATWEQMSWLLYMPSAQVSGTVTVDGNSYQVQSAGYHDHNWGEWNLSQVRWNWAQYSQPGFSFDLGDFIGNPNGRASVDIAGHRSVFAANQYKLVHTKFAYDTQNGIFYPVESVFTADNGEIQMFIKMNTTQSDPLPAFPGLIIYEQTSQFTGTVTSTKGGPPIDFEGNGFKEYTAYANSTQQLGH